MKLNEEKEMNLDSYRVLLESCNLDFKRISEHYDNREATHKRLRQLLQSNKKDDYVRLALGLDEEIGNFSASDHNLGQKILGNNANPIDSITSFANHIINQNINPNELPYIIYKQYNISHLKISVGSEIATMLEPNKYWIGNSRTIFSHLFIKHQDLYRAIHELELYKDNEPLSEMYYQKWRAIYLEMGEKINKKTGMTNLDVIHHISSELAEKKDINTGHLKYLWIDTICSHIYDSSK